MKLLFLILFIVPFGLLGQVKNNKTKGNQKVTKPTQKEDTTKPRPVDLALKKALDAKNYALASKYIQEGADINRIDTLMMYRYDSGNSLTRGQGLIALLFPPILAADAVGRHKKIEYTYKHFALWQIAQDSLFTPERYQTMEYLLKKGADPNHYSFESSILEKNVQYLDTTATKLLLQYGADEKKVSIGVFDRYEKYTDAETEADQDPQIKDRIYTIVEILYKKGHKFYLAGYLHPRRIDLYLKYFPEELNTLYINSCAVCNEEAVKHFEKKGAKATKEELSRDALSYMVFNGSEKRIESCKRMLKYLINKGADINTFDNIGSTILHNTWSYKKSYITIIPFLIENGANPLLKEKDGDTILMILKKLYQNNRDYKTKEHKNLIKYVQKQEKIYLAKQNNKQ